MTEPKTENRKPRKCALPDPHPADYNDDLTDQFYEEVEKHADQDDLAAADMVRSFGWHK